MSGSAGDTGGVDDAHDEEPKGGRNFIREFETSSNEIDLVD